MRIGVDLGGTKIEAIALTEDGSVLERRRLPTPVDDYPATIEAISRLVEELEQSEKIPASVGICTPGSPSPDSGLIRNANSVCLNGQPIAKDLEIRLQRPVRIANDADCFTLSEATDGAAEGYSSVFGVIIGTGTGGGIVINGSLLAGPNAIAGEWGHNPLPWPLANEIPGPSCYCGKSGCIETFLSGPGLVRDYQSESGHRLETREIVKQSEQGNEQAIRALERYEDRMARALASVINILDPEAIVLGGGMSNLSRLYLNVPVLWQQYVFSDTYRTRLLAPKHGDSSGVRGAAWLWSDSIDY